MSLYFLLLQAAVCDLLKTMMARKWFLPITFPVHSCQPKAYYRVNYGHAVNNSILEDEDSKDHEVTTSTQPCMTDKTMKSDVDPLLVLSQQAQTTWENRNLFTKSFLNPPPKLLFKDCMFPTAKFDIFFDNKVVEYHVNMTKSYAHQDKGWHLFNTEMSLFLEFLCYQVTVYFPVERCIDKIVRMSKNDFISNAMSRSRFEELMTIFFFVLSFFGVSAIKMSK